MRSLRSFTPVAAMAAAGAVGAGIALGTTAAVGGLDATNTVTVREVAPETSTVAPASFSPNGKALSIAQIYKRSAPGVVLITATSESAAQTLPLDPFQDPFGQPQTQPQSALGSGFVIDKSGYIVTNYHVVKGARSIKVTFSNNSSIDAKLVGSDPSTDIAVIKVNTTSSALTPLPLGDSDKVQVGDAVVAIGNPFGLSRTVTAGIVSAIQRQITAPNSYAIDHVIQTDAPINHGNSGGPLINSRGEVIGVNAQIETGGVSQGNVGVGFAIPSNTVKSVAAQLIKSGKVEHPAIGIRAQELTPDVAKVFRLPVSRGIIIERVQPRSGAAKAGLKGGTTDVTVAGESYRLGGDVIIRADGVRVATLARLRDLVNAKKPGDEMKLVVVRDGKEIQVTVKLGRQDPTPSG